MYFGKKIRDFGGRGVLAVRRIGTFCCIVVETKRNSHFFSSLFSFLLSFFSPWPSKGGERERRERIFNSRGKMGRERKRKLRVLFLDFKAFILLDPRRI